ncbi:alpha/beta hydrolase [Streptomyces sp. ODS28]|uniref:alpha/beta hydrolase n=1 Tax=Streptomyces sp. ODS28 TaxID=3136688 RepID=UPI0031EEAFED
MTHRVTRALAMAAAWVFAAVLVPPPATAHSPAPGARAPAPLRWHDCRDPEALPRAQCATLRVPLDWERPRGRTTRLALVRLPATDPDRRIGPLLYNGGGPGGPAVPDVARGDPPFDAAELAPLRARFDLVGMDPRGVGDSDRVRCGHTPLHDPSVSRTPVTRAGYERLRKHNRQAGEDCRRATGPLLEHVDTGSVVRDVDAVRRALGAPRISWLGLSYGTEIGALYAERYPERVRAMVLDGAVDHSRTARRAARDEARATEAAFRRFTAWCRTDTGCALHGRDPERIYDRVLRAGDRGGLPAPGLGRRATAGELAAGAYAQLTLRAQWPSLAESLAAAYGTERHRADATGLARAAGYHQPGYPAYRAVGCHDFAPRVRGPRDLRARVAELRAEAPHTWRHSEFWDWTSGCLGWPVRPANPPRPHRISGTPPILVVNTTGDPATPYPWALSLTARMERGRLLTVHGEGHTGILHSACARAHEAGYLLTGRPPRPGTSCRTSPATAQHPAATTAQRPAATTAQRSAATAARSPAATTAQRPARAAR